MSQPTFQLKTIKSTDDYAQIVIEPLEQGFGHTLGIALRRVLLEHIPGAAITSIQIAGINHQFTTLEGMKQDIVDLILNIKQLKIAYSGTEPVKATLKAQGPGKITAEQIELPSGVKLANPQHLLAELADKKSKLEITFNIESGKGYSPAEDHQVNTLGVIPIDALFSPIVKVNIKISDTRVGRLTNFDKLTLDIWTNSTIQPENVIVRAAEILKSHFQQIISPINQTDTQPDTIAKIEPEIYRITVEELELPTRIANALRKAGLGTVKELIKVKRSEIERIKNLGGKSVEIVEKALKTKGIELNEE
jgi:DNA-directed RNA polymerase subunit alpha